MPVKEHLPSLVLVLNLASSPFILCLPLSHLSLSSRCVGCAVPLSMSQTVVLPLLSSPSPHDPHCSFKGRSVLAVLFCLTGLYLDLGWKWRRVFKIRYMFSFPVILLALTPVDQRLS